MSLRLKLAIAGFLIVFGALHILAGALLDRRADGATRNEGRAAAVGD